MSVCEWHLQLAEKHGVVVVHDGVCAAAKVHAMLSLFGVVSYCVCYTLADGNNATVALFAEPAQCATCYTTLRSLIDTYSSDGSSECSNNNDAAAATTTAVTGNDACAWRVAALRQLRDVGWVNEDALDDFARKPYIVARKGVVVVPATDESAVHTPPPPQQLSSSSASSLPHVEGSDNNGYLLVQWQRCRGSTSSSSIISSSTATMDKDSDAPICAALQQALCDSAVGAVHFFSDDVDGGRLFVRFRSDDAAEAFRRDAVQRWPSLRTRIAHIDATAYALAHVRRRTT